MCTVHICLALIIKKPALYMGAPRLDGMAVLRMEGCETWTPRQADCMCAYFSQVMCHAEMVLTLGCILPQR